MKMSTFELHKKQKMFVLRCCKMVLLFYPSAHIIFCICIIFFFVLMFRCLSFRSQSSGPSFLKCFKTFLFDVGTNNGNAFSTYKNFILIENHDYYDYLQSLFYSFPF